MSWNYDDSVERIKSHLDSMGEIEIEKLVREADLNSLLSETHCRSIYGGHVYVQVTNFSILASREPDENDHYKRIIQAVHIYQREVARIVEGSGIFDGLRVHFQGPKLHALFYRPIDDGEKIAIKSVLLQLVLKNFVRHVFNPAFPSFDDFNVAGGADIGTVVGTKNGTQGDRELLFLGAPANYAAKMISSAGRLRLSQSIYDALPDSIRKLCNEVEGLDGIHQLAKVTSDELDDLLEDHGIDWSREKSADRIADDKRRFPLKDISYGSAEVLINPDSLSINNNKRVLGASIFGDVAGFTDYIDKAETEDQKKAALRVFHAIRKEMAAVIKTDFNGVRIQFQGDRVQGLFHLPKDEDEKIAKRVSESAIGLQSSMERSIKECLPESKDLKIAVGVDIGATLVSKLGSRGQRDRICLGEPVERAAACEERCEGGDIGVTKRVYDLLPEGTQGHFEYSNTKLCYVASGLTQDKVERASIADSYRSKAPVFIRSGAAGVIVTREEIPSARQITPAPRYGVDE